LLWVMVIGIFVFAFVGRPVWYWLIISRILLLPVIAGRQVVAATERGVLYVIDATTGAIDWQYDAGGNFTASPVVVDGNIIIGNGDGRHSVRPYLTNLTSGENKQ